MTLEPQITAVIKARNEAAQIAEAVQSAFLVADRVIVVDDDSDDATAELAHAAGAEVIPGAPHGGSIDELDRQGFLLVEDGWILRMDSDERVTEELARELRALADDPEIAGVAFARLNIMFGAPLYGGGWRRADQLRFFRASAWDRSWNAHAHSQVSVSGRIHTIPPNSATSLHFDYDSIEQFADRSLLRYASIDARQKLQEGASFRVSDIAVRPAKRFWGRLILRRGYVDGKRGLVMAGLLAAYDIVVAAHLWHLSQKPEGTAVPSRASRDTGVHKLNRDQAGE